ncbi:DUF4082 domain-containing protein [Corallococcus terminator]|uniref:DUF4082 domain-containing protein n=1 Tax=Corallococcus terminator TaxID=2316733 RepID=UPI001FC90534|nr:DUF4082 domain-containing protein [Corallococcus terminator]
MATLLASRGPGALRPGLGLDIAPYFLFGGGIRSLSRYRSNSVAGRLMRVLTKTTLSAAVISDDAGADAWRVGFGLRTTLHDPHDPVLNSPLPERVAAALESHGVAAPGDAEEDVSERGVDLSALFAEALRTMRARGDIQISAGWGVSARLEGDVLSADGLSDTRHTFWVTGQSALGPRFDVLATVQGLDVWNSERALRAGVGVQRKTTLADFRTELAFDTTDDRLHPDYWVDVAFQPNDTTPPSAPTNVTAAPNSPTAIDLTWYASVDGIGETRGNARAHLVYRGSQLLAELSGTTTSYRDTGLTPATAYTYTVRGRDAAGNVGPASATVTATTLESSTCNPCSLWNVVTGDPQYENADATPTEVGLKFRTDVAGTVTKVRYYKASGDTGPHVGHLWSATGTLLGTTAQTPGEGSFGWRELTFPTPVSVAANTTYVVSYFATGGRYAITPYYFNTAGVDVPPLHAPSTVAASGNGVRNLNGSAFPTEAWLNTHFWVDVAFVPATGDASPVDLSVQHDFPTGSGVRGQALSYDVTVTNHGTRAATNLSFDIPVPAGLAPYAFSPQASVGTCGYWVSNIMHCDITSLPAGQDAVIRMTLVPSVAGTFQFQATVTASETDNVPGNNTSTLSIPIGPATNVVTFDTFDAADGPITGIHGPFYFVYNYWYLASPWGGFTTKSISFNGAGMYQGELSIHGTRTVVGLDAFTWDAGATLTVSCFNQPTRTFTLTQGQVTHVVTNWQGTCPYVTLATSNGWDTNFDNIELSPLP